MAKTALMIGGPYHMKKMAMPGTPPQFDVQRISPVMFVESEPLKPINMDVTVLTYKPRNWLGNEVWVIEGLSDSAALDMLLSSAFNKRRGR